MAIPANRVTLDHCEIRTPASPIQRRHDRVDGGLFFLYVCRVCVYMRVRRERDPPAGEREKERTKNSNKRQGLSTAGTTTRITIPTPPLCY
eukprot:scaffold965_cov158-Amphora_coffeaeformis.AAC.11